VAAPFFQDPRGVVRKLETSPVEADDVRRFLFERALDAGLLDDQLEEDYDGNPDRDSASVYDFPDEIPYSSTLELDPDYENYNAFRFAAENPKVRQAIESGQTLLPADPDQRQETIRNARQALYDGVRTGRISLGDVETLEGIGDSRFLEGTGWSNESMDAVNDILRGTQRSDVDYLPAIQAVGDAVVDITDIVTPITARFAGRWRGSERLSRIIRPDYFSSGAQLGLPLGDTPENRALYEQASGRAIPESLAEFDSNLRNIQSVLQSYETGLTPESVLPQIRDLYSPSGRPSVGLTSALRDRNMDSERRRGQDNAMHNVQRRLAYEAGEEAVEQARVRRALDTPTSQLEIPTDRRGENPVIPGLSEQLMRTKGDAILEEQRRAEELREKQVKESYGKARQFLETYPEIGPYLQSPVRFDAPSIEKDFSKLASFVDTEQQISKPEDRLEIYKNLVNIGEFDRDKVLDVESKYTSGEPELQAEAIKTLSDLGFGADLKRMSSPAYSTRTPVVGGGGYEADAEVDQLQQRMIERARAFRNLRQNMPREAFESLFSSRNPNAPSSRSKEMRFGYDPNTNEAYPDPRGEYGIKVSTGSPDPRFNLESSFFGRSGAKNAVKFFAENPITESRTVSFETDAPGEGYSYDPKDLPPAVFKQMERFITDNVFKDMKPGTLISNSPIGTRDIARELEARGETEDTSAPLRKQAQFVGDQPNRRGNAYRKVGFGPLTSSRSQFAYVNAEGNIVPIQPDRPTSSLVGSVGALFGSPDPVGVTQSREPLTNKAYYSFDPVSAAVKGAAELAQGVRRAPAALLPGAADLIPSPGAIRTGYQQGPVAMGQQMGREFVQSLPTALAATGALAAVPVIAPGVGAGMVTTAGTEALNEVVRRETGEGIVPKLRQAIGTAPRSGLASGPAPTTTGIDRPIGTPSTLNGQTVYWAGPSYGWQSGSSFNKVRDQVIASQTRPAQRGQAAVRPAVLPTVVPQTSAQRRVAAQQANRNELQRRVDLAKSRFNPARGEFGLSELLRGR